MKSSEQKHLLLCKLKKKEGYKVVKNERVKKQGKIQVMLTYSVTEINNSLKL